MIGYDGRDAEKDVTALHVRGPRRTTQELIDVLCAHDVEGATVLDIGAGVGAVHLALLEAGAARAIDVDASREYQAASRAEAQRRGLEDRVEYRYGDVVELAPELPHAQVAVLDSVVCCYPYLDSLLGATITTGPRLVGLTYPRDTWWMRLFVPLYNGWQIVTGSPARYFLHRHRTVRGLLAEAGYREIHDGGSAAWRVSAFALR